jgi:hypothetical protein
VQTDIQLALNSIKRNIEGQIISKEPELGDTEIKGLIEDFKTIGILLKGHLTVFSSLY